MIKKRQYIFGQLQFQIYDRLRDPLLSKIGDLAWIRIQTQLEGQLYGQIWVRLGGRVHDLLGGPK
jgi:hypothetical protein